MIRTPPSRFRMTLRGSELSIQWNLMGAGVDMQHAPYKCTVVMPALLIRA
jgi:hypothetical protein